LCRLARPDRWTIRARHDLHLDRRRFRATKNRIGLPGLARHSRAIEAHRFLERPTRSLDGTALDLIHQTIGIDDQADIDRDHQPAHANLRLRFDLRDHGAIRADVLVSCESDAVAEALALFPAAPSGLRGSALDDCPG